MKVRKIHVFYHSSDQDGFMSGFLIKWAIDNDVVKIKRDFKEVVLHKFNIGFDIPFELIDKDDVVFFTDISATPEEMNQVYDNINGKMFWIDHHVSILTDHEGLVKKVMGLIDVDFSAVQNMHKFILEQGVFTDEQLEIFEGLAPLVEIVGNQDIYNKDCVDNDMDRWYDEILSVVYAMNATNTAPDAPFWEWVMDTPMSEVIEDLTDEGQIILSYIKKRNFSLARSYSFPAKFDGLNVLVLNQGIGGSVMFDGVDTSKYDAVLCYIYNGRRDVYSVSLYRTSHCDINLFERLKKFGFGGHAGAGGFRTSLFEIYQKNNTATIMVPEIN